MRKNVERNGKINPSAEIPMEIPHLTGGTIPEHVDQKFVRFVRDTFKKRVCRRYVPRPDGKLGEDSSPICCCGHEHSNHLNVSGNENRLSASSANKWNEDKDTETVATDAFGDVFFGGRNNSKYIAVDVNTDPSKLLELMLVRWNLEIPTLLISVTGGAQNFTMKPRLKEVFRQGLLKAAETTGAWIITGGTNAGVMKHVGEAVRDHTIKHGSKNLITTIGIATWGCISHRDILTNKEGFGSWPAMYPTHESNIKKLEIPLEPNHSHFILVDNGTTHKFGVEIALRTSLENIISTMKTSADQDSVSVPAVCVVLEGGPNTLQTVQSAIKNGTPCIVVEGSGRAADVLAYAYHNSAEGGANENDSLWEEVGRRIEAAFKPPINKEQIIGYVKDSLHKRDYLTVFRLDEQGPASDIDRTILKALLKIGSKSKKVYDHLKLAMAWNRADVAREEIYTDDAEVDPKDLCQLMYSAIVQDKVEFVRLFLSKGVNLTEFLSCERIIKMYNDPVILERCKHLKKKSKHGHIAISLKHVGEFMKDLIGEHYDPIYCLDPYRNVNPYVYLPELKGTRQGKTMYGKLDEKDKIVFEDPAKDIFLWCVLAHMKEMAILFWDMGKEDIAAALTASHMMKSLREMEHDSDLADELEAQRAYYDQISVGVLANCYKADQHKTTKLLIREMPSFGRTTLLKMAVQADNKEFIAHPACQNLLTSIWTGKLTDDNSYSTIAVVLLLPVLAPFLLRFREKDITQKLTTASSSKVRKKTALKQITRQAPTVVALTRQNISCDSAPTDRGECEDDDASEKITCAWYADRFKGFMLAPFTTFCYNCMSYFAFLVLYGVILLTDFYPIGVQMLSIKEIVLIIWIGSFCIEEIRQIVMDDALSIRSKLYEYITDLWNIMDVVTILSYIVGLILRFIPPENCERCFYSARIILALNLMVFFFRILHMFSVHKELGPKLVMIERMLLDLFYFLIILLVFIAAYGISSNVILYPNQPLNIALARDVMSDAWWTVIGNINTDDVAGNNCNANESLYSAEFCAANGISDSDLCNGKVGKCPAIDWFVPILLAIYSLVTNVMMLNLLIAMFSNTFSIVEGQTNVVWKMQRYELIREYASRPILPPPLILFAHLYYIGRYLLRIQCCSNKDESQSQFRVKLGPADEKELINWESIYAEEYIRLKALPDESSAIEISTQESVEKSGDPPPPTIPDRESTPQFGLSSNLETRFSRLEEQVKSNLPAVTQMMEKMESLMNKLQSQSETEAFRVYYDVMRDKEKQRKAERKKSKKKKKEKVDTSSESEDGADKLKKSRASIYPVNSAVGSGDPEDPLMDSTSTVDMKFEIFDPQNSTIDGTPMADIPLRRDRKPDVLFTKAVDRRRNGFEA